MLSNLATNGVRQKVDQPRMPSEAAIALRDLMDTGTLLRHVVSRRAGLSESELTALDHLSRDSLGPAEVARLLDVCLHRDRRPAGRPRSRRTPGAPRGPAQGRGAPHGFRTGRADPAADPDV